MMSSAKVHPFHASYIFAKLLKEMLKHSLKCIKPLLAQRVKMNSRNSIKRVRILL